MFLGSRLHPRPQVVTAVLFPGLPHTYRALCIHLQYMPLTTLLPNSWSTCLSPGLGGPGGQGDA